MRALVLHTFRDCEDDVVTRMDERALRKYVRTVLEHAMGGVTADQLLLKINKGFGGSVPVDQLSPEELDAADELEGRGLLRHVPAGHGVSTQGGSKGMYGDSMAVTGGRNVATPVDPSVAHRYPERYVVTSGGSHAVGTFKTASLHR